MWEGRGISRQSSRLGDAPPPTLSTATDQTSQDRRSSRVHESLKGAAADHEKLSQLEGIDSGHKSIREKCRENVQIVTRSFFPFLVPTEEAAKEQSRRRRALKEKSPTLARDRLFQAISHINYQEDSRACDTDDRRRHASDLADKAANSWSKQAQDDGDRSQKKPSRRPSRFGGFLGRGHSSAGLRVPPPDATPSEPTSTRMPSWARQSETPALTPAMTPAASNVESAPPTPGKSPCRASVRFETLAADRTAGSPHKQTPPSLGALMQDAAGRQVAAGAAPAAQCGSFNSSTRRQPAGPRLSDLEEASRDTNSLQSPSNPRAAAAKANRRGDEEEPGFHYA